MVHGYTAIASMQLIGTNPQMQSQPLCPTIVGFALFLLYLVARVKLW